MARTSTMQSTSTQQSEDRGPVQFEIIRHLGVLAVTRSGWKRELNIVSWNGRPPRLDIRDWHPEHNKMGRGIGLDGPEVENLLALLEGFNPLEAGI